MNKKSVLLLVGAIALACATALVARVLMRPPPPVTIIKEVQAPRPVLHRVLTARQVLRPGVILDAGALAWREVPAEDVNAMHIIAADEEARIAAERSLLGATPRREIAEGTPLGRDAFVFSGQPGFIAAVLAPGMRAISIPTTAVSSNAGLVSAGDWVDVILSLERSALTSTDASNPVGQLAAQTILRQVRVLALDSRTESLLPAPASTEPAATKVPAARSTAAVRPTYESMTLEVSPEDAERLVVAREVGSLQVALRGVKDGDAVQAVPRKVTRLSDATAIYTGKGGAQQTVTVKTFQGAQQGSLSFQSP